MNISADSVVILGDQPHLLSRIGAAGDVASHFGVLPTQSKCAPPDAPQWAKCINDCEVGYL